MISEETQDLIFLHTTAPDHKVFFLSVAVFLSNMYLTYLTCLFLLHFPLPLRVLRLLEAAVTSHPSIQLLRDFPVLTAPSLRTSFQVFLSNRG